MSGADGSGCGSAIVWTSQVSHILKVYVKVWDKTLSSCCSCVLIKSSSGLWEAQQVTFMRKERLKSLDYGMEIKGLVSELHLVFLFLKYLVLIYLTVYAQIIWLIKISCVSLGFFPPFLKSTLQESNFLLLSYTMYNYACYCWYI